MVYIDIQTRSRALARVERLAAGNPEDVKPVGKGVSELRIDKALFRRKNSWLRYHSQGNKSTWLEAAR